MQPLYLSLLGNAPEDFNQTCRPCQLFLFKDLAASTLKNLALSPQKIRCDGGRKVSSGILNVNA